MDFYTIKERPGKKGSIDIYARLEIKDTDDLMIRGSSFYAIYNKKTGLWSTNEQDALDLMDEDLCDYYNKVKDSRDGHVNVLYFRYPENHMIDSWIKYCDKQMRDRYHQLNEKIIFSNTKITRKDYASFVLPYAIEEGSIYNWDYAISTWYSPENRHKIEWSIGSIITGDSKWIQKFDVFYGPPGSGKSSVFNIIEMMFGDYCAHVDMKSVASNNPFGLEQFKKGPLIAIQHDGDLSRIEDNARLNSLVSHETMQVNEKFKSMYENSFKAFLFMGTNKPVKISDAKSGLNRRLIDISPTGKKLSSSEYKKVMEGIKFELGAIAYHCRQVYLEAGYDYYDDYVPIAMLGASNDFYNYILENYYVFEKSGNVTLKTAWELYNVYNEDAKVLYSMPQRAFKEELKNYFEDFKERWTLEDGTRVRSYFIGFKKDAFQREEIPEQKEREYVIEMKFQPSILDKVLEDMPAQYAVGEKDTPGQAWSNVTTKLMDISTSRVHYVKIPENHIVIDFDIKDEEGNKCKEKNLEAAAKFPPTYTEFSKSGGGVHLHYIYDGDVDKLEAKYAPDIEIKVFKGNMALRRKLSQCNDISIATISSGLPLKKGGKKKMVTNYTIADDTALHKRLIKIMQFQDDEETNIPSHVSAVSLMEKVLEEAYASGIQYDISDLKHDMLNFAAMSTHNSETCINKVMAFKFSSEDPAESVEIEKPIAFFDIEVFPNLLLVNWKYEGKDKPVIRMINPTPEQIEELVYNHRLIGFNNRRYDNHILYARMLGYDNEALYSVSTRIVGGDREAFFGKAYDISYTDVYDFTSNKQSLKKYEIELGIHHQELGLRWDQPVPENMWNIVAEYCDNDVIATEAVFNYRSGDFLARQILAEVTGMTVNDTTNSLTTRLIFGTNRAPQGEFNYRNLSLSVPYTMYEEMRRRMGEDYIFRVFDENGIPQYRDYVPGEELPTGWSIMPFFPGYSYDQKASKSYYMDELIGEGGRVYSEPGIYEKVDAEDVGSMHPHSLWAERGFGKRYSKNFYDLVRARMYIKHKDFKAAGELFDGKLKPYLKDESQAKALSAALKIAINSVYGLTSASFPNPFKDPRNVDNIVAKRGALFMTLLKHEVQKLGYTVCHIKTDCIKVPYADEFIVEFIVKFGKEFGYSFETESVFDKFCLVNDAVYIGLENGSWEATGTQFAVPYVFKTLFSHEELEFDDLCETKSVSGNSSLYLDMNENLPEGEHNYVFIGRVGRFTPIKDGFGGGILLREKDGKYSAAVGSKGYRWLESETLDESWYDKIDISYYDKKVQEAKDTINRCYYFDDKGNKYQGSYEDLIN